MALRQYTNLFARVKTGMIDEVARLRKLLWAERALERPLARVLAAVRDQVPRDGKGGAAVVAHERTLARVRSRVLGQIALRATRGGAARMIAHEGALVRVDALVRNQVAFLAASVFALVARVGFHARMNLIAIIQSIDKKAE
jgi:hypothetical protein